MYVTVKTLVICIWNLYYILC